MTGAVYIPHENAKEIYTPAENFQNNKFFLLFSNYVSPVQHIYFEKMALIVPTIPSKN